MKIYWKSNEHLLNIYEHLRKSIFVPARRNARSDWIRRPCRMARAGVSNPNHKSVIANLKSADLKPPSYLPPAPPRIPPGRLKMRIRSILWFSKNNSQCRASWKKLIRGGPDYEFASKMQASRCLFHDFSALTHFSHHIFSKLCFLPTRGAQFCKTASSAFDQTNPLFCPPNGNEMTPKCGNVAPKSPKNDPKRLVCAKNAPSMYRISFAEMSISRLKRLVIEFRTNFDRVLTANDPKTAPKWPEATLGCPKWPQSDPKMIPKVTSKRPEHPINNACANANANASNGTALWLGRPMECQ